jgi:hypothetical protein
VSDGKVDGMVEERPSVTVSIRRSSSRDGGTGWDLSVTDAASEETIAETIRKAVSGHQQLQREVAGEQ